jgi:hypothetical protein
MGWVEKQARYYCSYLADERGLIPVTILLANAVAVWLLAYLISSVGTPSQLERGLSQLQSMSAILKRASDNTPAVPYAVNDRVVFDPN